MYIKTNIAPRVYKYINFTKDILIYAIYLRGSNVKQYFQKKHKREARKINFLRATLY